MMKIQRGNQECLITECESHEWDSLAQLLTREVPGAEYTKLYRKGLWDGTIKFFSVMKRTFPSGLLAMAQRDLKDLEFEIEDRRSPAIPGIDVNRMHLKGIELRDYQVEAVKQIVSEGNGLWEMATNAGKTIAFVVVVNVLCPPLKGLILTHRVEIFNQIVDALEKFTDLRVGKISSSEGCEFESCDVVVGMVPTVVSRLLTKEFVIRDQPGNELTVFAQSPKAAMKKAKDNWEKGAKLQIASSVFKDTTVREFLQSVDVMILDEVHHAASDTWQKTVDCIPAVVRLGCSGTVPGEDTVEGMKIRAITGSVLIKVTNEELIEEGISATPIVRMVEVVADLDEVSLKKAVWRNIYKNGKSRRAFSTFLFQKVQEVAIVHGDERNKVVCRIVELRPNKSVLIVVDLLDHGRLLKKMIPGSKFLHGGEVERKQMLKDFDKGKLQVLVSSNVIDEGVDISRIGVLVLAAGKRSRRQLLQRLGRGLRRKQGDNVLELFDFVDFGQSFLEKHSKERLKVWRSEGFDIQHLEAKDLFADCSI